MARMGDMEEKRQTPLAAAIITASVLVLLFALAYFGLYIGLADTATTNLGGRRHVFRHYGSVLEADLFTTAMRVDEAITGRDITLVVTDENGQSH